MSFFKRVPSFSGKIDPHQDDYYLIANIDGVTKTLGRIESAICPWGELCGQSMSAKIPGAASAGELAMIYVRLDDSRKVVRINDKVRFFKWYTQGDLLAAAADTGAAVGVMHGPSRVVTPLAAPLLPCESLRT